MDTAHATPRTSTPVIQRYAITIITTFVLGTLGILLYLDTSSPPQPPAAPQFTPNPSLESVVNATADARKDRGFIGWKDGDTLGFPMKLHWSRPDRGTMHAVTIYDNRGTMVWSGASTDTTIAVEKNVDAGLFYIMLEADGVLRQMKRCIVVR